MKNESIALVVITLLIGDLVGAIYSNAKKG